MDHQQQHQFTNAILAKISEESGKPISRIKKLIVIKQNQGVMRRFWELVYEQHPDHPNFEMSYCPGCDAISLE